MNTQKLVNFALEGLDNLGYHLDQLGVTGKVNRHNLAAFLMAEQKHFEGEWDSLQAKFGRRRSEIEHLTQSLEKRADSLISPVIERISSFRTRS
ncbi:hypothetical protein LPB19_02865 [Marinobacter salinisoli]|uniref:Uncharacterized protein n=1 Tax=Marinobacter salinisoli TaxID=2769486 RepID=A0ABX7MSV8_9GAMM|nr:hypothetical protein [Marinobacter salinisoli]QSP95379.1 hypothetical protein LPB19_02865 [Marinobacter salinisoli]